MKNVLYIPQWSMYDGRYLLNKDGNYTVLQINLKLLKALNEDITVYVGVMAIDFSKSEIAELTNITQGSKVVINFLIIPYTIVPIVNRFHFDVDKYSSIILEYKIDMIINNIPELSQNFRYLEVVTNKAIPIVTYNHFPDHNGSDLLKGIKNKYFMRQADGIEASDIYLFNCYNSSKEFIKTVKTYAPSIDTSNVDYITFTDFSDDAAFPKIEARKDKRRFFVFPSRITSTLYTNWHLAFEAASMSGVHMVFCNPTGKRGIEALKKQFNNFYGESTVFGFKALRWGNTYIINQDLTKKEYYTVLSKSTFSLNLYFNEHYGGLAQREATIIGDTFPIVPAIYAYKFWYSGCAYNPNMHKEIDMECLDEILSYASEFSKNYIDRHKKIIQSNILNNEDFNMFKDKYVKKFKDLLC